MRFRAVVGVLLGLLLVVSPPGSSRAQADPTCPDILFLGSRGSGENLAERPLSQAGDRFFTEFRRLLPGKTVESWPNPYDAVAIVPNRDGWLDWINGLGALANAKNRWFGKYVRSVAQGEQYLTAKITETITACPATQLVLGGYSQGAQVTGNVYQALNAGQRSHVLGTVLIADPLFNGSDEAVNRGSYDPERNGVLPIAPRGEFQESQKVLSYCHRWDPVCQGIFHWNLLSSVRKVFSFGQHTNYHTVGDGPGEPLYPDTAAEYFANRVRPAPPSAGPVAEITSLDDQAPGVLFRVSGCASESKGRPLTYDWDLDNSGAFATRTQGCVLRTTFAAIGDYPIALRVTNDVGQSSVARTVVHVVDPGPFTGMPGAPTNVVSTPSLNNTSALLTWQPPASGPPAEAYRVYAADGTLLATVDGGGPGSFSMPAESLPLAVVVQSINRAGDGGGVSPPVTMFVAGALPDGDLNALWNAYGDQGGHWTGGDSTVSVELPGGRVAWLFSDTFLGEVNPDGSRPRSAPMIRNSVVVQQGNALMTLHGGAPETPRSLVELPDEENGFLWVADGTVENNQLKVIYNRYTSIGTDPLDVKLTGAFLATFSIPDLQLMGITDLGRGAQIAWSSFYEEPDFTYIYGTKTDNDVKFLHIARAPSGSIGGAWQFWNGQGWSSSEADAAQVMSGIDSLSVTKIDNRYVMFAQDADGFFSSDIVAYYGSSPTGPFVDKSYLYTAPEPAQIESGIVYGVQLHPEFGAPGKYVLSYNVNTLAEDGNYNDARIYRPRFIDVALPMPAPNPANLPAPPTNLRATTDDQGVHLSWTASTTPGVSYHVYQRDVTGRQTQPTRSGHPVTSGTSYNPRFLKNDRTYEFFVTAFNTVGESPRSNLVSAVPRVRPPLAAPTGLRATPADDGTITLSWNAVPDALSYMISFKDDGTASEFALLNRQIPATTFKVNGLASGHTYTFKVAGYNEGGGGPNSAPVTATARIPVPQVPTNLTAMSNTDGTITLRWTAPTPDAWYWVDMKDVSAGEPDFTRLPYPIVGGTTFTAGLLTNGHVYDFRVSAINGGGVGPPSNVARATSLTAPPGAPTNLRAVAGNREVTLSWTAPGPNVWYWFYLRDVTAKDTEFTRLPYPKTDGGTTFTGGLLANGHTYEFYVTAINNGGEGSRSNIVSATPKAPLPAAPTGLTATAGGDLSIALAWNAPEPDAWYWLYRRDVSANEAGFTRLEYPVTDGTRFKAMYGTVGHIYEWRVSAINSGGEGPLSNVARATARLDPPHGLSATATNDGSAMLSWTGPGEDFWYYLYSRDVTAGQGFTRNNIPITTGTGFAVGALQNGHVYEFYVTTIAPGGAESGPSNIAQITAHGGTPAAPGLSARAGDGRVDLSWSATGDMYWIYKRCVDCGETNYTKLPYPTEETHFTDTWVANGYTYEYRVSAINAHGEGGWSNPARVRPLPPIPGPPTGLTAQTGDGHVILRWNAPGPNMWYWLYLRDVTAGQAGFTRSTYPITNGPSVDAGLLWNGHTYEFYVTAINVAGEGPRSNIVSARPLPPFPTPPRNLRYVYTAQDRILLQWEPSTPPQVYYYVYMRNLSKYEGFDRLIYPIDGTSFPVPGLRLGHRYEFFVTSVNVAGESGWSNIVFANPGPRDLARACASVAGNGTPPDNWLQGEVVYYNMRAAVCGQRRGDFIDVSGSWTSNGRHVNVLSIHYKVYTCGTGWKAWEGHLHHPNNPPYTSGSGSWSIYIDSGKYYYVQVSGEGDVEEPGIGNLPVRTRYGRTPPNDYTPPFISSSHCF